MKVDFQHNSVH